MTETEYVEITDRLYKEIAALQENPETLDERSVVAFRKRARQDSDRLRDILRELRPSSFADAHDGEPDQLDAASSAAAVDALKYVPAEPVAQSSDAALHAKLMERLRRELADRLQETMITHTLLVTGAGIIDDSRRIHAKLRAAIETGNRLRRDIETREATEHCRLVFAATFFFSACVHVFLQRLIGWTPFDVLPDLVNAILWFFGI